MTAMLTDRVVVITGGAGLLGKAFCEAAAAQDAIVVVADINQAEAENVAAGIARAGGRAQAAAIDITDRTGLDRLIQSLHATYGRIDAVVIGAYPKTANFGRILEDVEYADFCANLSAHLGGYFLAAQRFAEYFVRHGGGNIVTMASIYGVIVPRFEIYQGTSMTSPVEYAAIKAGVIHLTRYFAQYYKTQGVRCNALAPGGIADAQPESFVAAYRDYCGTEGLLAPKDLTGALLFLLSDASRFMTGQCVVVDDGFSL